MSNGETQVFNLEDFTWVVHRWEVDTVMAKQLSSTSEMSMEIIHKTLPVYHYHGHFYYLGMWILLVYQWSLLVVNHQFQFD